MVPRYNPITTRWRWPWPEFKTPGQGQRSQKCVKTKHLAISRMLFLERKVNSSIPDSNDLCVFILVVYSQTVISTIFPYGHTWYEFILKVWFYRLCITWWRIYSLHPYQCNWCQLPRKWTDLCFHHYYKIIPRTRASTL